MAGLIQALVAGVQAGRRQHADRAGQHRRFVGQDVPEHVAGHHDVEALGRLDQLHRGVVDIHVVEGDVGVLLADLAHDVLPELEGLQHVGFVDAGDALASLAGRLERDVRDPLDLGPGITHRVEGFLGAGEMSIGRGAAAAGLAEVDIASQFANDQDVQPGDQLGLEAGSIDQFLVADGGTEVGEQAQTLAQAQHRLLWTQRPVELVVLPVADRAEQNCIRRFSQLQRGVGQRMAVGFVGGAADQGGLHLERQVQHLEHLDRLGDDFRSDAVTRQHCDFHATLLVQWISESGYGPAKAFPPAAALRRS